jgi:hypothetical protein
VAPIPLEFKDATLHRTLILFQLCAHHKNGQPGHIASGTDQEGWFQQGRSLRWKWFLIYNRPTVCTWETGFAKEKKSYFIRADFYLNDAFQLNSLKLLMPPQNVSISKQGGLGFFHFADRKRKSIEKTCSLFKSHYQPQTQPDICGASSHNLTFYLWSTGNFWYYSL